jgi:hypothetical protein
MALLGDGSGRGVPGREVVGSVHFAFEGACLWDLLLVLRHVWCSCDASENKRRKVNRGRSEAVVEDCGIIYIIKDALDIF